MNVGDVRCPHCHKTGRPVVTTFPQGTMCPNCGKFFDREEYSPFAEISTGVDLAAAIGLAPAVISETGPISASPTASSNRGPSFDLDLARSLATNPRWRWALAFLGVLCAIPEFVVLLKFGAHGGLSVAWSAYSLPMIVIGIGAVAVAGVEEPGSGRVSAETMALVAAAFASIVTCTLLAADGMDGEDAGFIFAFLVVIPAFAGGIWALRALFGMWFWLLAVVLLTVSLLGLEALSR